MHDHRCCLPVVQFTFERLGKAETTEFDTEYQSLCDELDKIRLATERLIQFTAYMLEPNPSEWDAVTYSHTHTHTERER